MLQNHYSVKFNVMYVSVVFDDVVIGWVIVVEFVLLQIKDFGGNDGVKDVL